MACVHCGGEFVQKQKGFKRVNLDFCLNGEKIGDILAVSDGNFSNLYLCNTCLPLLKSSVTARKNQEEFGRRSLKRKSERTPEKTPRILKLAKTESVTYKPAAWKTNVHSALMKSRYTTILGELYRRKAGRKAITKFMKHQIRRETVKYGSTNTLLSKKLSGETLKAFSWPEIITEMQKHLPLLYSSLCGTVTNRVNEAKKLVMSGKKYGTCVPILGMAFAILMYGRQPKKFNFIQELCALEMWSSGSHQKLFQCFQRLGISKGVKGAKRSVDRLRKEFDEEIMNWKSAIEDMMDRGNEVATATPATDIQQNVTSVSKERARIGRNEAAITEPATNLDQNVITLPEERARIGRNEAAITEPATNLDQNVITLPEERARIGRNEAAITEPATNLDQNVITLPEDYSPPFSLQSDAAFNASIMIECSTPVRKEEETDTIPFKLRTELFTESPIPRSDSEEPIQAIDSSYHEAEESKSVHSGSA